MIKFIAKILLPLFEELKLLSEEKRQSTPEYKAHITDLERVQTNLDELINKSAERVSSLACKN